MSKYIDIPAANYDPPAAPGPKGCIHKWVYMETARQHGKSSCYDSPAVNWRRTDRFYCEKCLEIKEIIKTAPGWEDKPEWFD
jgi:hypothetical protein